MADPVFRPYPGRTRRQQVKEWVKALEQIHKENSLRNLCKLATRLPKGHVKAWSLPWQQINYLHVKLPKLPKQHLHKSKKLTAQRQDEFSAVIP